MFAASADEELRNWLRVLRLFVRMLKGEQVILVSISLVDTSVGSQESSVDNNLLFSSLIMLLLLLLVLLLLLLLLSLIVVSTGDKTNSSFGCNVIVCMCEFGVM